MVPDQAGVGQQIVVDDAVVFFGLFPSGIFEAVAGGAAMPEVGLGGGEGRTVL